MTRATLRVLLSAVVAFVGVWLVWSGPLNLLAEVHAQVYDYDAPAYDQPTSYTATQRGPPVAGLSTSAPTGRQAVYRGSRGALTRSNAASNCSYASYGHQARCAYGTRATGTPKAAAGSAYGISVRFEGTVSAAETAPELASGLERTGSALNKSDAFHRSVSWVVDNPAAQRFSIKGGDGVSRELYQLPGEVNGKSGVFE